MAKKQKKKRPVPAVSAAPDYTDARQLEAMIRRTFKDTLRQGEQAQDPDDRITLDTDPARMKRRIAAIVRTMPRVRELAAPLCTLDGDLYCPEEDWAFVNTLPVSTYEDQNEELSLLTAAALWMLDRIKANGRIDEAIALLPRDDDALDAADCPQFFDPVHHRDVLRAMVFAIERRNADCVLPVGRASRRKGDETGRVFDDLATALGVQRQDVPSRRRFEALLALIPEADRQDAARRYEEKLFEWIRLYFRCRATFFPREKAADDEMRQLNASVLQRAGRMCGPQSVSGPVSPQSPDLSIPGVSLYNIGGLGERMLQNPKKLQAYLTQLLGPRGAPAQFPLQKPAPSLPTLPETGLFRSASRLEQMQQDPKELQAQFTREYRRIMGELDQAKRDATNMAYHSRHLATLPAAQLERTFGPEIAALGQQFRIDDPYETCFAFLSLMDSGSDLPWLYFPCVAVNHCAGHMLPWYYESFEEADDWHRCQYYAADGLYAHPEVRKPPELPDWYRMEYRSRSRFPEEQYRMNLAQMFYEATGCLMPRDLHRYDDALRILKQDGLTGKRLQLPMLLAMSVAGECRYQSTLPQSYAVPDAVTVQEPVAEQQDPLLDRLDALKQENERLKRSAYEAERTVKRLQQEHTTLQQQHRTEHQELAELRELLFHRENGTEPEQDEETAAIPLPYEVRHTTVVFGGHDSWARAIKPMLTGRIRFIDRDMQPEAGLIRHAEVVWLQANSIRHAFFYTIIRNIRTYGVPIHYFQFASAEKCARQLAEVDAGVR